MGRGIRSGKLRGYSSTFPTYLLHLLTDFPNRRHHGAQCAERALGTARRPGMPRRAKQLDADVELPPSRSHSQDGQRQISRRTPRQRAYTHDRRGGRNGQRTGNHASAMRRQEGSSSDEADEEAPSRRSGHRRGKRAAQRASSAPRQEASSSEASSEASPSEDTDEESPRRNVGLLGVSPDGLWQSTGEHAPSAPRQGAASSSEESQSHRARRKGAGTVWTDLGISLGLGEAQPARGASKTKPPRRVWTTPGPLSTSPAFEKLAPSSEETSDAQARRSTIAEGGRCMPRWLQAWLAASAATQARCVAVLVLAAYALVRSQMPVPESLRGLIVYSWS